MKFEISRMFVRVSVSRNTLLQEVLERLNESRGSLYNKSAVSAVIADLQLNIRIRNSAQYANRPV